MYMKKMADTVLQNSGSALLIGWIGPSAL